jgi:hypothetical protein
MEPLWALAISHKILPEGSKHLIKPSLQPVTMEPSSEAMQQDDPLLFLLTTPVKMDLYSERSQTFTAPFSSIERN